MIAGGAVSATVLSTGANPAESVYGRRMVSTSVSRRLAVSPDHPSKTESGPAVALSVTTVPAGKNSPPLRLPEGLAATAPVPAWVTLSWYWASNVATSESMTEPAGMVWVWAPPSDQALKVYRARPSGASWGEGTPTVSSPDCLS